MLNPEIVAAVAATIPPPSVVTRKVWQRTRRHAEQLLDAMAIADAAGIDYSDVSVADCGQLSLARDAIRARISAVRYRVRREKVHARAKQERASKRGAS